MNNKESAKSRRSTTGACNTSVQQNVTPGRIEYMKQEQERLSPSLLDDLSLSQILGDVVGELVPPPSTSTPINDRSSDTVNWPRGMEEPSPIPQDNGSLSNIPTGPAIDMERSKRRLFQEDSSPLQNNQRSTQKRQTSMDNFIQTSSQSTVSSSTMTESTNLSEPSSAASTVLLSGNKRKKGGTATPKTPAPKKCKRNRNRQQQVNSPTNSSSASSPQLDDSGVGGDIDADYTDSNETIDTESGRDTVDHVSIHRLPLDELYERFENSDLSEVGLIEQIMDEINQDIKNRYKHSRSDFELRKTANQDSDESESTETNETFGFVIRPYVQRAESHNSILASLGIIDDSVKKIDVNFIIFYHRPGDVYALTANHTWQAIQRYCCYDFPCLISGRLTRPDGNVEEVAKPLAGNKRKTNTTKKNATMVDRLKNVTLNWTKEVRPKSSLFTLREFNTDNLISRGRFLIQFGLAYVRIKRRMDLKNLPEILDHFTKICRGETTYGLDRRAEAQIDEFPYIRPVDRKDITEVENSFYELLNKFMHKQHADLIQKFDFVDKHISDFCNAEDFELSYTKEGYDSVKFPTCPTAFEVLNVIRTKYSDDLLKNEKSFTSRFKNNIKITYYIRGRSERIERRVVDLLEGEMIVNDREYWKIMGIWFSVSDEYHFQICKEFCELLKKPGIYVPNLRLPKPWNKKEILSVKDYVKMYENECINNFYYYLPPSGQVLAEQNSQSQELANDDGERSDVASSITSGFREGESHFFDLFCVRKNESGSFEFYLFYIFDGFDSGIRDASTRISKSIELLLKDTPITSSKSLLEKFWSHQVGQDKQFKAFFPEYDPFRQFLTAGENVSIVVGFATQPRPVETGVGPLDQYVIRPTSDKQYIVGTFSREKDLKTSFNRNNVKAILDVIKNEESETYLDYMCSKFKLEAFLNSENKEVQMDLLTGKVLGIISEKYCLKKCQTTGGSGETDADMNVSGKLLRIRNCSSFKLFEDSHDDKIFFKALCKFYITGFPGFVHKLECFQINEDVSKEPRLTLNFIEIN